MDIKGKKMLFLGDSITQGAKVDDLNNLYWKRLEINDGCIVKGYGISGTRIAKQHNLKEGEKEMYFRSRVPSMDEDADVVVVFGGVNDHGHGDAALGTFDDRCDDTFYGALHNLYTDLINKYPTAKIVVMTPCHRVNENGAYNSVGLRNVGTLKDYVDVIKRVAEYYALPLLDLYSLSGFQPDVESNRAIYMPDGLHPSDAGHEKIYTLLKGFLETL
jgi:lysophospholipase L1-like esterase